ncbi:pheromone receptor 2 [Podospora didyma]|uniref:Pheromone receptor 2 n=1 Tax=Podospora didyma TaxID=330526 RepID=A0AAE0NHV2_9PEZI|nr:pheromone receptor 2 [Podospora didyma]
MASNTADASQAGFDPLTQPAFVFGPDGQTPINFTLADVDIVYRGATSAAANYGSQFGASFIMLAVMLAMTPKRRFKKAPTIISLLALIFNLIRMVMLCTNLSSSFVRFYTIVSFDLEYVDRTDVNVSVTATILSIPITILIELALMVQAWSMLQLWPSMQKWATTALSVVLVVVTIGFNFAVTIIQARAALLSELTDINLEWVRKTYLGLITASICWFCFLFNLRLVIHMWTNRAFLPSLQGLKAMDVLVVTNGILMLVPVLFAVLEFFDFGILFQSASLTQTSVIVLLPLGTLVAQRLANPSWFCTPSPSEPGGSGGTGGNGPTTPSSGTALSNSNTAMSRNSKRPLLATRGTTATNGSVHRKGGLTSTNNTISSSPTSEKGSYYHHADKIDMERARIDDGYYEGLDRGNRNRGCGGGDIRVDRTFERSSEERVPETAGAANF